MIDLRLYLIISFIFIYFLLILLLLLIIISIFFIIIYYRSLSIYFLPNFLKLKLNLNFKLFYHPYCIVYNKFYIVKIYVF